jgi:hypothetical protein
MLPSSSPCGTILRGGSDPFEGSRMLPSSSPCGTIRRVRCVREAIEKLLRGQPSSGQSAPISRRAVIEQAMDAPSFSLWTRRGREGTNRS